MSLTKKNNLSVIEIKEGYPDTISFWIGAYFRLEVTTSESSQKVQRRDLTLFRDFLVEEAKSGDSGPRECQKPSRIN